MINDFYDWVRLINGWGTGEEKGEKPVVINKAGVYPCLVREHYGLLS